jgi:crossover junction endodeoxyribonuclease RuvC
MNGNTIGQITFRNIDPGPRPENKLDMVIETKIAGYIGIDPGATGAIALLDETGAFLNVLDYPGSPSELWLLLQQLKNIHVKLVVIEKVSARPKQGVVSMFKFGQNFGSWIMAVTAMGWSYELVSPQRWRKILDSSVPHKPEKEDLRQYALRRWLDAAQYLARKKDHGRGEALIMAAYARFVDRGSKD